jgi:hypothetical protein
MPALDAARFAERFVQLEQRGRIWNYGDGVDGAPTGIDVPRWSLSQPI